MNIATKSEISKTANCINLSIFKAYLSRYELGRQLQTLFF